MAKESTCRTRTLVAESHVVVDVVVGWMHWSNFDRLHSTFGYRNPAKFSELYDDEFSGSLPNVAVSKLAAQFAGRFNYIGLLALPYHAAVAHLGWLARHISVGQITLSSSLHPSDFDVLIPKVSATSMDGWLLLQMQVCQVRGESVRLTQAMVAVHAFSYACAVPVAVPSEFLNNGQIGDVMRAERLNR